MFCRGIKGEFDFLREEFENFVLICPKHTCSGPLESFALQNL